MLHRVWREWLIENDTFIGMHFVSGQECSVGDREVKVLFNCSTMTRLHGTSEPSTCHYVIWLDTPLACFKGAMQGTVEPLNKGHFGGQQFCPLYIERLSLLNSTLNY